jgi:hypothetical protein
MADPITMAMLEEAATAFMKDQAMQAMGPEVAAMGGAGAMQSMGGDVGGLLGQTQNGGMAAATAPPPPPSPPSNPTSGTGFGDDSASMFPTTPPASPGVMDTLKSNVMSDFNKSPYGQAYNTFTNPNAKTSDYTSLGYQFAFSPEMEKQNQMSMGQMPNAPAIPYGGRTTTVGGIPDLLKKYGDNSGLLQYLG